ncbi:MAG: HAMP domain-containing histidine kinase [Chitinophagaceae bacterium]|nr:HAMP domain-containing histidine kinase [Chitinophagaceae bacterium]
MQIQQITSTLFPPKNPTLHTIVNELIHDAAALAVHNRNFVINNIPADLRIEANGTIVTSVLSKLFNTVFRHTQNSGILISAKVYGMVVLVQVKSNGQISPALPEDLGHASQKARTTGGVVEVVHYENKEASVAYCFLNVAAVA